MKNAFAFILVVLALIGLWLVTCQSLPEECTEMNNQTCPVSGNQVNDKDTFMYKGKIYRLCSEKCREVLSQEPEKFLKDCH